MHRVQAALALILFTLAPCAEAITVPADWWSNQTSVSGVVDPPGPNGPERLRLAGGFNTGTIEGTVALPFHDEWTIQTIIGTDGNFNIPTEYVDIYINNSFAERFNNTPRNTIYDFEHQLIGDSFNYRFEFSSPSTDFGSHLIVGRGTVTNIPEPVTITAALLGVLIAARRRR